VDNSIARLCNALNRIPAATPGCFALVLPNGI
jgi:hypothetical protein